MPDEAKRKLMYLRLSKEDDDASETDPESFSITSQRLLIRQYIELHPELGGSGEFEELIDDGYSGTNFNRPGITRLLELVESEKAGLIIVKDLSRFARNYLEAGHFLEFVFPMYGVRFISVNDHYDSRDFGESTGGLQLAVRNLVNQLYSKDISRKIKSAVDMKKLSGEYVYGTAPYGYKKGARKNTIVIDLEAAGVVRSIFQWASEGVKVTQIAVRLNEAGVKTPSAYLKEVRGNYRVSPFWTFDSIKNILTNRIYTGDTVPFKSHVVRVGSSRVKHIPEAEQLVIPDTHEAIISREMFCRAREVISGTTKSKPAGPSSPFSKYLVCGCCGNKLTKGRKSNKTFRCAVARYAPGSDCEKVHIDEGRLSEIVLRAIQSQCGIVDMKVERAKKMKKEGLAEQAALQSELHALNRKIDRSQANFMRSYEEYVGGQISRDEFLARKSAEKSAEDAARVQLLLLTQKLEQFSAEVQSAGAVIQEAKPFYSHALVNEITPALLHEFIQSITIYPDGVISIKWNYKDPQFTG